MRALCRGAAIIVAVFPGAMFASMYGSVSQGGDDEFQCVRSEFVAVVTDAKAQAGSGRAAA